MFIDTHCHLDAAEFKDHIPEVLARARQAQVTAFVIPGVDPAGLAAAKTLGAQEQDIHVACGMHPMLADRWDEGVLNSVSNAAESAVAVGEIGLDYMTAVSRDRQMVSFREQLRIAVRKGLPVIVHCRKAFSDLLDLLREEHAHHVGGVMHAYSGSAEMAADFIRLGFAIGVCGTVTYENAVKPVQVVKRVPLDHFVLETDAPDLTPAPFRGTPNEPAHLSHIARKVAELKGIAVEEVARVTTENARGLFRFK